MARLWILYTGLILSLTSIVQGRAPGEQRKYRTAYACEGSTLSLSCDNSNEVINLLRANYGRFSITICNEHGDTDWSVNCMSHRSLRVLHSKCSQQTNCSILASTNVFGDPCPGTLKYLEAHYQCVQATPTSSTPRPRPPWFSSVGPSIWNTLGLHNTTTTTTTTTTEATQPTTSSVTTVTTTVTATSTTAQPELAVNFAEATNATTTTTMATTTTTTTTPPNPLLVELTEVTVLVPDFPGRSNSRTHNKKPSTPSPQPIPEEMEEEVDEDEDHDEENGKGQDSTTPTSTLLPTTRRIQSPGAEGKQPLAPPSDAHSYCPPTVTRGLYWNWTKSGDVVIQPCPGGATGYARWRCSDMGVGVGKGENPGGASPAAWFPAAPDLSECKSVWLTSLESRIGEGDSIISISNDLAQVTNSKTLYGGDMIAAARLLRQMANKMAADLQAFPDWRQREAIVSELVQSVVRAGSSLLGSAQSLAWRDLGLTATVDSVYYDSIHSGTRDQHARSTATALLTGFEENAFLLANTITRQKSVFQAFDNILMSVRVIDARNINDLTFPSAEELQVWKSKDDSIILPDDALLENSEGGLVRVVLFAYEHMEDILSPYEEARHNSGSLSSPREGIIIQGNVTRIVNSRVISASLGKGRHIQLPQPVTIRLQHLRQENVSNPTCVFWDYTVSAWSNEGCRVMATNKSHTLCSCDHLTNFAILMDLHSTTLSVENEIVLTVITYVGCSVSILCLLLAIIIFIFFRGLKSDRTTIHKNLCLCLLIAEIIFIAGINQTHDKILCGLVAGLLHFFFLCAFMWMFLEGFQLYVLLVEVFESEKSRVKWYYICGYGVPTIIVAISCVVDPLSYGTASYCWLRADNYFIFSFVGPVIVILLANFIFLSMAICIMCRHQSTTTVMKSKEQSRLSNARLWIRGAFVLVFLLGLTWTFGLLYLNEATVTMAYIFTILNSFQGLFIFFFHCVQNEKVRKEIRKVLHRSEWWSKCFSSSQTGSSASPVNTKENQTSCYGSSGNNSTTPSTAPPTSTYLPQSWSGTGIAVRGGGESCTVMSTPLSHTSGSMRLPSKVNNLRASAREIKHASPHDLENGSFKSYGRDSGNGGSEQDDCSPRQQQLLSMHRATAQQVNSMGRRGNYPHPVPNPALAEGAALDAQLIAQFRENSNRNSPLRGIHHTHLRNSKRSRSASPWNHTYMEIDLRSRNARKAVAEELEEGIVDPVYEEIERSECPCRSHHYQQGSDLSDEEGRRQNSDVSRQSSRSYGDNRPLIPLHQGHPSHTHDLLTTISCAFNSPHLRTKHRHPHESISPNGVSFESPMTHEVTSYEATPIHMGFETAPNFDLERYSERPYQVYDENRAVSLMNGERVLVPNSVVVDRNLIHDPNRSLARAGIPTSIPFTEC